MTTSRSVSFDEGKIRKKLYISVVSANGAGATSLEYSSLVRRFVILVRSSLIEAFVVLLPLVLGRVFPSQNVKPPQEGR